MAGSHVALSAELSECSIGFSCIFHPTSCWESCKCTACKTVVGPLVDKIAKSGCGAVDVAVDLACEVIFLGPEDPAAELCAVAFDAACPTIASAIASGITQPVRPCARKRPYARVEMALPPPCRQPRGVCDLVALVGVCGRCARPAGCRVLWRARMRLHAPYLPVIAP